MEQLRSNLESLLTEVNELSNRNEELMAARDADDNVIRDLNAQLKEYKRKYEQAKTELRSVKGVCHCALNVVDYLTYIPQPRHSYTTKRRTYQKTISFLSRRLAGCSTSTLRRSSAPLTFSLPLAGPPRLCESTHP